MKIQIEVDLPDSPADEVRKELAEIEARLTAKLKSKNADGMIADIAAGLDIWQKLGILPDEKLRIAAETYLQHYVAQTYTRVIAAEMEQLAGEANRLLDQCHERIRQVPVTFGSIAATLGEFWSLGGSQVMLDRIEAAARQAVERVIADVVEEG